MQRSNDLEGLVKKYYPECSIKANIASNKTTVTITSEESISNSVRVLTIDRSSSSTVEMSNQDGEITPIPTELVVDLHNDIFDL